MAAVAVRQRDLRSTIFDVIRAREFSFFLNQNAEALSLNIPNYDDRDNVLVRSRCFGPQTLERDLQPIKAHLDDLY